ncbi:AAA family ATPase [Pseudomonas sp. DNDY-54]|uniref:AAA family ATPase n=1 Tax=Pseudomonas sp. DNDY-54 TaxID=2870860 RepID=UPI0021ADC759|nr:AAA family ATPase [Pseudomonas sp. DNDY-54]
MPNYLKEYVTEFNYLFSQIQVCASIKQVDDKNYTSFYNFGNNARKFFEIYLYYKYPNEGMTDDTLVKFFGDEAIPASLTSRINNEYSHLAGVFERGAAPTEVPEMQKAACAILARIKLKDPEQYYALMDSIGADVEEDVV